eukprot:TRINITY_DN18572_c0_g1_i1.p1 TRINITY_DN18572_c0_g1~~TRINITY_DN18572_c0_g1_i1.p1  ORF type:complete len:208 (-),score=48.76 TRINITY_DN18572_c0_g1_i1:51-617(-)
MADSHGAEASMAGHVAAAADQAVSWEAVMNHCATVFTQMLAAAALPAEPAEMARKRVAMLETNARALYHQLELLESIVARIRGSSEAALKLVGDSWQGGAGPEALVKRHSSSPSVMDCLECLLYMADVYESEYWVRVDLAEHLTYDQQDIESLWQRWQIDQHVNKLKVQTMLTQANLLGIPKLGSPLR